jgi:hypothetical protein
MSFEEMARCLHDSHAVVASYYLRLLDEETRERITKFLIRRMIDALSEGPGSAAESALSEQQGARHEE